MKKKYIFEDLFEREAVKVENNSHRYFKYYFKNKFCFHIFPSSDNIWWTYITVNDKELKVYKAINYHTMDKFTEKEILKLGKKIMKLTKKHFIAEAL